MCFCESSLYLVNTFTYFHETHHIHSLPDPYDGNGIFKVTGLKSRSASNGRINLVNSIYPKLVNGFEPKLTKIFHTVGPRTD